MTAGLRSDGGRLHQGQLREVPLPLRDLPRKEWPVGGVCLEGWGGG